MSRGTTLPELMMVTLILAMVAAIGVPTLSRMLDRMAVTGGADRVAVLHEAARHSAISRGRLTRLELDTSRGLAVLTVNRSGSSWDTLASYDLGGARVSASQTRITFGPLGVGAGLSNSRIVLARGAAAETLTVSRTGRLRRNR